MSSMPLRLLKNIVLTLIFSFIAITVVAQSSSNHTSNVLIVGGGSSHDFDRWFNLEDSKTLAETGAMVRYTNQPESIDDVLPELDILYLSNNQPMPATEEFRNSIFDFVKSGNGLLLVHPSIWYNWQDWPEYNKELVAGGSRSHEAFGEFEVKVTDKDHPVMDSVPASFDIVDELYHYEPDHSSKDIHVLATGIVPESGEEYPVVWTLSHGEGRIVAITLGHDGKAHHHSAYKAILQNSIKWLNNAQ